MKLLWVEDERRIVEEGTLFLEQEGCKVTHAATSEDAVELLNQGTFDLLLIDWMLPGQQGIDLCKEVQSRWKVPVIMLTARTDEWHKVIALEIGSDDYITKPFGMRELLARIKAVLRRSGRSQHNPAEDMNSQVIQIDGLVIDAHRHEVSKKGLRLQLTPTEFALLHTLAKQPGRVFSRLHLLEQALGDAYLGYERTIDSHIRNLRSKVEDDPANPLYIVTVYGIGYKFGGS
ncbi:MAG: DNA-binding response regulator [Paenibacillus sp.]|nr:DNA-binding response regulator [Paenibacillus sp.]